jgi:PAS domain S-box-containing protein
VEQINKNKFFYVLSAFVLILAGLIINYILIVFENNKQFMNDILYKEAKTHFENIKLFRKWNAQYNGVYVKQQEGIEPNPYLKDNSLKTQEGETMIRINPAWMTRQVTEMINKEDKYYYHISSLNPLNPKNLSVGFEKEALEFFQNNQYRLYVTKIDQQKQRYELIGQLKVETSCLECHAHQGYKVGDIRGVIRVGIPMQMYDSRSEQFIFHRNVQIAVVLLITFIALLFTYYILHDIQRKQNNLSELKERYKKLYSDYDFAMGAAKLGLWDWNLEKNSVYFSKNWKEMLGYKQEELPNDLQEWDKRVHPDDKQRAIDAIKDNQNKKTEYYENIHRLQHKDGSWVWILDKGKTIFNKEGKAIRMMGIHLNITHLEELRGELTKLKTIIEHSPLSIVITDTKGNIEYVNPWFCKTTGYEYEELIGQNPEIFKSEFIEEQEYQKLQETLIGKQTWTTLV